MANIQPFDYQKSTNIEEHNQIVNKVNEIVEVINNVNLDTINSEIANLKANATATDTEIANIKNKNSAQDTEIDGITKSLVSNVTATFDNPSRELKISLGREASPSIDATVVIPASSETGQYSAGNGITIDNYQIAVDTGVVALKSDIPVVPDISQLTADVEQNKTDIQTINTEITGITNDITSVNNKNTEQDTAIAGKVAISQGVENAGKVLGIGSNGNVTPVDAGGSSGGGEVWEEVDLTNIPTNWKHGDKIKVIFRRGFKSGGQPSTWTQSLLAPKPVQNSTLLSNIIEFRLDDNGNGLYIPCMVEIATTQIITTAVMCYYAGRWTTSNDYLFALRGGAYNGNSCKFTDLNIDRTNIREYIFKMWRLKQ